MADADHPVQAIEVVVPVADVDLASGLLWAAGVAAVGEQPLGQDVVLVTDVPPGGPAAVVDVLGGRWPVTVVDVADDGLDGWRPFAAPARAGRHLVVVPPWVAFEPGDGDEVLSIDPGRAFGHGAHPTTRLVLAEVERLTAPGTSVLDVGCGSGVLAVAAARLGAGTVVAVDIDPEAVTATAANAAANSVMVHVSGRPVEAIDAQFDLVLANIGSATLVALADAISSRVAAGGALVLSGLLAGGQQAAVAACSGPAGFSIERTTEEDGWVAVVLRRRPD